MNLVYFPSSDSQAMVPPISLTTILVKDRPKPVPSWLLV